MTIRETPLFGRLDIQCWDDVEDDWMTLIPDATKFNIRRGGARQGLGIKTDVGILSFELLNAQDPLDGGTLYPGQPIRVMASEGFRAAYDVEHYFESFAASTGGWTSAGNGTVSRSNIGSAYSGTYKLHQTLAAAGTTRAVRTVTGLTVGRSYTMKAWVYRANLANHTVSLGVTGITLPTAVATTHSTWVQLSYTFTATATSHELTLRQVGTAGAVNGAFWEDVALTEHVPAYVGTPIFTGRVAFFGSAYPLNKRTGTTRTVVNVTVADAVQIHGSTMRYGVDLGVETNETFEERIERLDASANAPIDVPVVGAPLEVYAF